MPSGPRGCVEPKTGLDGGAGGKLLPRGTKNAWKPLAFSTFISKFNWTSARLSLVEQDGFFVPVSFGRGRHLSEDECCSPPAWAGLEEDEVDDDGVAAGEEG